MTESPETDNPLDHARLLETVLETITEGVVVCDKDGKFLLFNPHGEKLVGRGMTDTGPEEWQETYGVFELDGVTPFPTESLPLIRALQGEESNNIELFIRNASVPNGRIIDTSGRPLRDESGEIITEYTSGLASSTSRA